jgi:hypothetical protein
MGAVYLLLSLALGLAEPTVPVPEIVVPASEKVEDLATSATTTDGTIVLPALSTVELEIAEPLNSKASKIGQFFAIKLATPILLDGQELVPAGAMGQGEVIHAAKARAMGKAGELILAARYIEHDGKRIALRSFQFGLAGTGKNNSHEALAAGTIVATPLVLIITGGNVDVPVGTKAHAKTASDTVFNTNGGQKDVEE